MAELTPDWRHRAACRDEDPELFFPIADNHGRLPAGQLEAARAVCHICPVRADCEQWAVETGQAWGVWGGTTPSERAVRAGEVTAEYAVDNWEACGHCGRAFTPDRRTQRWCSPSCRTLGYRNRKGGRK